MNIKRFLHVLAIMSSSLLATISHGHADSAVTKNQKKSGENKLSKPAANDSAGATVAKKDAAPAAKQEAPRHGLSWAVKNFLTAPTTAPDPSLVAAASLAPQPTLFRPMAGNPYGAPPDSSVKKTRFPWKEKIVTTTFYIGETPTENNPVPNTKSSWDKDWVANYGGFDNPDPAKRKDFIPLNFTPRQNPFYVALPYNDMEKTGFKDEASTVVPWFKTAYQGPMQSVCKDRWVAIRYGKKVVYAQWEDCGPFLTDHWQYVFGTERPKPNLNHGAGLDVSPAVRDYLGMNDSDVTDWRFVEFNEVPPGPWSKLGDNNTFVINQREEMQRAAVAKNKSAAQNGVQ